LLGVDGVPRPRQLCARSTMQKPAFSHCLRPYEPDSESCARLKMLEKIGDALK
jgi:hypothetical protein